jgi:hypothetical protein
VAWEQDMSFIGKKTVFPCVSPKMIILPRQARDKHTEIQNKYTISTGNIPDAHDFFMYKAGIDTEWPMPKKRGHQPSITLTDEDGYSVIHGHPLNGTKFFTWGSADWGKFQQVRNGQRVRSIFVWTTLICQDRLGTNTKKLDPTKVRFVQDFMAATDYDGKLSDPSHYSPWDGHERYGDYTELQVGPAASQEHVFPVVANSEYSWTEWFASWMADEEKMQHRDYNVPLQEIAEFLDGESKPALHPDMIADIDEFLSNISNIKPETHEIIHAGQPWGGLCVSFCCGLLRCVCPGWLY